MEVCNFRLNSEGGLVVKLKGGAQSSEHLLDRAIRIGCIM